MEEAILLAAIEKIQYKNKFYANSKIVFGAEYAPARTPASLEQAMIPYVDIITVKEVRVKGVLHSGVPKTWDTTREMVRDCKRLMDSGAIRFSADYMTVGTTRNLHGKTIIDPDPGREDKIKKIFHEGLYAYEWKVSPDGEKGTFTGKGNGRNDDLTVAWMMGPYWSTEFITKRMKNPSFKY